MQGRSAVLLVAAVLLCAASCAPLSHRDHYHTVAADPHRNPQQARKDNQRGLSVMQHGTLEEAEQAFQDALVADVTFGPAHNNLGKIYYKQGKFYLAAWEFEYAARLMPSSAAPMNNLGMVYEAVERLDEAIAQYEMAHAREPRNPEYIGNLVRARLRRGDKTAEVRWLLQELLLYDTRHDWTSWARDRLALAGLPEEEPATIEESEELPVPLELLPIPEDGVQDAVR